MKINFKLNPHYYAIFVTGSDSGIGNLLIKKLYDQGCEVIAGCYTQEAFHDLQRLGIKSIIIDTTNSQSVDQAYEKLNEMYPEGLWSVICNAGIGQHSFFDMTDKDTFRKVMEVNFFGTLNCIKRFLPLLRKKKGRLIIMSSLSGGYPPPGFSAYSSSKAALSALTDTLRIEMKAWDITVCKIEPGGANTGFIQKNLQGLMTSWETCDHDIKEKYGKDWLKNQLGFYRNVPTEILINPEKIVDAYVHACLGRFPKSNYRIGFHQFMLILPDFILYKLFVK